MKREPAYSELFARLYARVPPYEAPHIEGKRVLVTGAGGSIGSALCEQLVACRPAQLVCVDMYDGNLYNLEHKLDGACRIRYLLSDVRDFTGLTAAFAEAKPDFVFHAAALKHVPMLEEPLNMIESARTNVIGTFNVLRAAADQKDCFVVNVSTDKAVEPYSILGLTKRCAEVHVTAARHRTGIKAVSVRFGNVLDSIGSVVPLFKRQIAAKEPVTITDVNMERFFMTLEQAASLVVKAGGIPSNWQLPEVFVLDMGGQVRTVDLAEALARNAGTSLDELGVQFTGIRPGEKLSERLWYSYEIRRPSFTAGLSAGNSFRQADDFQLHDLREAIIQRKPNLVRRLMSAVVPEYTGDFVA